MIRTEHEQLIRNLEYLNLTEMKNHIDDTINLINKNNLSFSDGLIRLTNYEIDSKEKNAIRAMVKVGAFPHLKELNDFDFSFQETINEKQIRDFTNHRFIKQNENIVFLGNSGVGKTHLATSIGISAAKKRISTYFIKCNNLVDQLRKAKIENRLENRIKNFTKYKLLIIDEMGYLPINKEDSKLLFQLIDKRYENKSTIITTNINFSKWDEIFMDTVLAGAIIDRILHHSHIVNITGKSYRLKNYYDDQD